MERGSAGQLLAVNTFVWVTHDKRTNDHLASILLSVIF